MPPFNRRFSNNYARKQRRIAKYGLFKRPFATGKRTGYVKGKRGLQRIRTPIYMNPFSQNSELVQLKYSDTISLSPGISDSLTYYQFSANSLYDPDISGTGHQPCYYDNFTSVWGKYCVRFSVIKATIIDHNVNTTVWNGSSVASQPSGAYKFAIIRDENLDMPGVFNTLVEQNTSNIVHRFVSPTLTGTLPTLTHKCSPAKTTGLSADDDTLTAYTTGSPPRNCRFVLVITSADPSTLPPSVKINVSITYYVKFFDRVNNQPVN